MSLLREKLFLLNSLLKNLDIQCPMCGYNLSHPVNYAYHARKMYEERKPETQEALKRLSKLIKQYVPADNTAEKQCKFLWGVREVEDKLIVKAIEDFIIGNHYVDCKGYPYIKAIINNIGKNNKQKMENEKKKHGIVPPIRRVG